MTALSKKRANPNLKRSLVRPLVLLPDPTAEAKVQLGSRIPGAQSRQLKLAYALHGIRVQTLVEHAIDEFFANHPELLIAPARGAQDPMPSRSRKQR